jgi:hypothetical protein
VAVRIEAFDPGLHDTKDFRCGSDSQDNFLRRTAKRQQRDGYTRLYVATDATQIDKPRACLGFYAINAHAIGVLSTGGSRARGWGASCWWMPCSSANGRGRSWVCG